MENKNSKSKAFLNGVACKCPKCGEGKMFKSFLKVNDNCPKCGEELFHHTADDMPAYVVVVLIGHIIVPFMLWSLAVYNWPDWIHMVVWLPLCVVLSVLLIQPVKGAIIALQWAIGLHGFEKSKLKSSPDLQK